MRQITVIIALVLVGTLLEAQALASHSVFPTQATTSDLCPLDLAVNNVCFVDGTLIRLKFELPCDVELGNVDFESEEKGDEIHVFLKAKAQVPSQGSSCESLVSKSRTLSLPNQFGRVVIHGEEESI